MIGVWGVLALAAMPSSEVKLPSGATLIQVPRRAPWTSFAIALPFGSDADPPGKAGLARAAGLALAEHIQSFASGDSPRGFERMGAIVDARTGRSATILLGGAPADRAEE